MGHLRSHAIAVSSWSDVHLAKAHAEATRILSPLVTPIMSVVVNSGGSFFVAPDGSKEGWDESDDWDEKRTKFIAWMRGCSTVRWAEVLFADDDDICIITRHDAQDDELPPAPVPMNGEPE